MRETLMEAAGVTAVYADGKEGYRMTGHMMAKRIVSCEQKEGAR